MKLPFVVYALWGVQKIPWKRFATKQSADAFATEVRKFSCWVIVEGPK